MGAQSLGAGRGTRLERRRLPLALVPLAVGSLLFSLLGMGLRASRADEPTDAIIGEHLSVGEFGPARRLAEQEPDPARRDGWLASIAQAQAQAGARSASLATAADIGDDQLRAGTLRETGSARGRRGGNQADFDSLIDLIQSTVAPDTWGDAPGQGSIMPFQGGVLVDADGVLRRKGAPQLQDGLAGLRQAAFKASANSDSHRQSPLRKISLTRLEKQVQLRRAAGRRPSEEMSVLAGLEKIQYVLIYPESGDIVLAGPADEWMTGPEGRTVARNSQRPVLQLDDLVVIFRHLHGAADARFGCSITPSQEALKRTREFLEATAKQSLSPGGTKRWLEKVRASLGKQTIDVYGIDPRTRVARVLVEADYRMKLVGMGLEQGTLGVRSYLDSIELARGQSAPPLDVLRWWFTLNYDALRTTPPHDAFELRGQGVQVQSENEIITELGGREHTGQSKPLNRQFVESFTKHFPELAEKYPVYAELQNLFDLAIVAALIKTEDLKERVRWHMTCFGDPDEYHVALGAASTSVETVMNHRIVNQTTVLAGVSGGVSVDPWKFVRAGSIKPDTYRLKQDRESAAPRNLPKAAWWWD